jgi:predicted transcriptional regulator
MATAHGGSHDLERALRLLGPLEARIMRTVWSEAIRQPFVVREMLAHVPELAYTTVMTTLNRLADKGLLLAEAVPGQRAHAYRAAGGPDAFLGAAGARAAEELVARYGDAALAAFAAPLEALPPEQRRRLERLGRES